MFWITCDYHFLAVSNVSLLVEKSYAIRLFTSAKLMQVHSHTVKSKPIRRIGVARFGNEMAEQQFEHCWL